MRTEGTFGGHKLARRMTAAFLFTGVSGIASFAGHSPVAAQFVCVDQNGSSQGASATMTDSVACGTNAVATGGTPPGGGTPLGEATAIGSGAKATNVGATAIGENTVADSYFATAIGISAQAENMFATALGPLAYAWGNGSVAIGYGSRSLNTDSIAIGTFAQGRADGAIALGYLSTVSGLNGTAIGYMTGASAENAVALGYYAQGSASDSVAIGSTAHATGVDSIAIGSGADAPNQHDVAIGSASTTAATANVSNVTIDGTTYNFAGATNYGGFSVGDAVNGLTRQIQGVSAGRLSSTSTDAVNGSQLFATDQAVDSLATKVNNNTQDIANLNTTVNNVTGDITNIKGDVTNLTTTVNNQGGQIASLDQAAVKYTLDSNGNATNEVQLTGDGSGAAVVIKNVATGVDATDAVNVGQLRDAVNGLSSGDALAVKYVGDSNGKATNTVALTGDGSGSAVTIQNVAAGTKDTDAANYGQIKNQVAYDTDSSGTRTNTITLSGNNGASVVISNVGDGVADHDAANIKQLNGVRSDAYAYTDKKVGELRDYTDARLDSLSGNIRSVQSEARAGISGVAAQSQLRYADKPGVVSVAAGLGGFKGSSALAAGLGWTSQDQAWRLNGSMGVSLNTGDVTWGVGASYAFE